MNSFNVKGHKNRRTLLDTNEAKDVLRSDAKDIAVVVEKPVIKKIRGKRNDPNFVPFTTYIRRDRHREVKIALLKEGKGRELSELVDELLANWLNSLA